MDVLDFINKVHIIFEKPEVKLLLKLTDLILDAFSFLEQVKHVVLSDSGGIDLTDSQFDLLYMQSTLLIVRQAVLIDHLF